MSVSALMKEQAQKWELALAPEAFEAFDLYAARLKEANQTMNLTAVDDDEGIARRHFLDSLRPLVLGWIHPEASLVDVGTGAGFPGLGFGGAGGNALDSGGRAGPRCAAPGGL